MTDKSLHSRREIIEQAAAWHARVSAHDATPEDWQRLDAWLGQDAEHEEVFESMGQMQVTLRSLGEDSRFEALHDSAPMTASISDAAQVETLRPQTARRPWRLRPRQMALAAGVLVALVVPLLYYTAEQEVPEQKDYQTAIAERRSIELEDGSTLTLNVDTDVTVRLAANQRQVVLRRGEVFLDVVTEPDRQFSVDVGDYVVTVTGTSFVVRYRDGPGRVTVHEGSVRVESGVEAMQLQSRQQLVLRPGAETTELSEQELSDSSDWRNGWLHFDNISLADFVEELDPYVEKEIILTSRRVGELEVGGSFNVDNVDSIFAALEMLLPIDIRYESDRIIIKHESDTWAP